MDHGRFAHPLSWLLAPVAALLVVSALSLPSQPYTGLRLNEGRIVTVEPGSPGAAAGLAPGDRLRRDGARVTRWDRLLDPLQGAAPGRPLSLLRERGGRLAPVELVPASLTVAARRMRAIQLLLASGFVLLGGLVWSERRDRLTRPFFLLSLAFAWVLAPPPRLPWPPAAVMEDVLYAAMQLVLPALCVHFFALFPEPRAPRGRLAAGVHAAYGVAGLLFAVSIVVLALRVLHPGAAIASTAVLQTAAALWFPAGLLTAVALFARSYRHAGSADARRRLRVALIGTALGLGPIAGLILVRNLSPAVSVPGERLGVVFTLFVPLSFAWATVVHRVFDVRVALRAGGMALIVGLTGAAVYLAGERLLAAWGPGRGFDFTGAALAAVALGAALAGPAGPLTRGLAFALVPGRATPTLSAFALAADGRDEPPGGALARARDALTHVLKLDHCAGIELESDGSIRPAEPVATRSRGDGAEPSRRLELSPRFATALADRAGPMPVDDSVFAPADREALEGAGFQWVLPVRATGSDAALAALLLGRRLAGPWLDRRESEDLDRFARDLGVVLENVALRRAAQSHGVIDRELAQAGAIQAHLLPRRAPVYPTLDCAAATLSTEPVGGDYYDFVERSEREFTLAVGDAVGHGVPAALLLAGVQARFRNEAGHGREPGDLLTVLNRELVHLDQPEKFVGLLCARVEVRHGRIWIANAGLTPPLVRRHSGAWEEVTASGTLLGVRADSSYPDTCVTLAAGDLALVCTDGLTEARRGEELFGEERVRAILDRHAHRRASRILEALILAVREFAHRPLDDLTAVVLKQLADPSPEWTGQSAIPLKWRLASADTPR